MGTKTTSELTKRVGTATVGVVVLLGLIIYGHPWLFSHFIVFVLSVMMTVEFGGLVFSLKDRKKKTMLMGVVAGLAVIFNMLEPVLLPFVSVAVFVFTLCYFLFTASRHRGETLKVHTHEAMMFIFGLVYLVALPLHFVMIRPVRDGHHWVILFLLIVWAGDIAAYFVGKRFGKHKLYSIISPKKTWEGAIGGLFASIGIALLYKVLFFTTPGYWIVGITALLVGIFAQIGDLCESMIKRAFDVKDSGSILPGHGGFLDRFDGVIFSLPVMYACIRVFA